MRVNRALNLAAWAAITLMLMSPILGFAVELGRQWITGGHPAVTLARTGVAWQLVLLGALSLLGLLACANELQQLLAERTLALAQSNFASAVTHELRTPLTTIRMYADLLRQGMVTEEAMRQKLLGDLCHECDRLDGMIDDVLAYAEIGERRRTYRFEPVEADALVADALAAVAGPLHESGMTVERDIPPGLVVEVDRAAMTRALTNLVGNAVKYAADGKLVHLRVTATAKDVEFAVRDFGPGIPVKERKRVFQPFYRALDELTRTRPGNGLGLALVESYVKAHAGRVAVTGAADAGTIFTITLPRRSKSA